MAKLYYQGHGSYRFTTNDGLVIYVDPYAGSGYDLPADLILVTHGHHDHNKIELVTQKPAGDGRPGCRVITHKDALAGGVHNRFDVGGISIQAVQASGLLHRPKRCVGYLLRFDGLNIYCSGDTSKTAQMSEFAALRLDYAILCIGGPATNLTKSTECARIIGAKHNIPVHMAPGKLFDRAKAEKWDVPGKLIIAPGEEITL